MKKTCVSIFVALVLCLVACRTEEEKQTPKSSNTDSEMTADTGEESEEEEVTAETIPDLSKNRGSGSPEEGGFALSKLGKVFLLRMCKSLNDFDSQTIKDEAFWRDFLFRFYTGPSGDAMISRISRNDLGYEERVAKVSLQEAEAYAKLIFGTGLPDIKPSFEDMEEGQTAFYYQDGYYYIGVSDSPDYRYTFTDYEESDNSILVRYAITFEGESDVGTVTFTIVPYDNENGFIITSKTTEYTHETEAFQQVIASIQSHTWPG